MVVRRKEKKIRRIQDLRYKKKRNAKAYLEEKSLKKIKLELEV